MESEPRKDNRIVMTELKDQVDVEMETKAEMETEATEMEVDTEMFQTERELTEMDLAELGLTESKPDTAASSSVVDEKVLSKISKSKAKRLKRKKRKATKLKDIPEEQPVNKDAHVCHHDPRGPICYEKIQMPKLGAQISKHVHFNDSHSSGLGVARMTSDQSQAATNQTSFKSSAKKATNSFSTGMKELTIESIENDSDTDDDDNERSNRYSVYIENAFSRKKVVIKNKGSIQERTVLERSRNSVKINLGSENASDFQVIFNPQKHYVKTIHFVLEQVVLNDMLGQERIGDQEDDNEDTNPDGENMSTSTNNTCE